MPKSRERRSNLWAIRTFTTFVWVKDTLSCFKQFLSNLTAILELWIYVNFGAKLVSDNYLDFNLKILSIVELKVWKYLKTGCNIT